VLLDLRTILEQLGITALRETPKEMVGRCPLHEQRTGKTDSHPSWSMNRTTYVHSCFSCGYKGTLNGLFRDITGEIPDDLEKTLAKEGWQNKWRQVREQPAEVLDRIVPTLTEWALTNILGDVPQRLLNFRNLVRSAVDQYEVRWDGATKRWVLPLRSPDGDLLGAQYRQKGSFLTLPDGLSKSHTLFGFPQCCSSNYCALVESPLDAVRLFGLGIPAVSSLGAWVSKTQTTLLARNFTRVYLAFDNDKTGLEATASLGPALRRAGTAVIPWRYDDSLIDSEGAPAKDLGDVASDDALLASWQRTLRLGL
jgi:DNA primase